MFRWSSSGELFHWRRSNRRTVELFIEAMNARDVAGLKQLLVEDFLYLDTASSRIEGRDAFLETLGKFWDLVPDTSVRLDSFTAVGDDVLVKGGLVSADPKYAADSLWQAGFAGELMCRLQAFRENNAISIAKLARR